MGGLRSEVDLKLSQVASDLCHLHSYFSVYEVEFCFSFQVLFLAYCTRETLVSLFREPTIGKGIYFFNIKHQTKNYCI